MKRLSMTVTRKLTEYILRNGLLVSFFVLFSVGLVLGSVTYRTLRETPTQLPYVFEQFISGRENASLLILVCRSLFSAFLPLLLSYCFGLFMYGYIPCFLLVFIRGMGYGMVSGYIYTAYELKGVAFVLLVILPAAFIHSLLLFIGAREAFRFSVLLSKNYFRDLTVMNPCNRLKRYHYQYLILSGFTVVAALMDGLLSRVFMDVFGF